MKGIKEIIINKQYCIYYGYAVKINVKSAAIFIKMLYF